jgi:hypothetical protein
VSDRRSNWSDSVQHLRTLESRRAYLNRYMEMRGPDPYKTREVLALEFVLEVFAASDDYADDVAEARRLVAERPPTVNPRRAG